MIVLYNYLCIFMLFTLVLILHTYIYEYLNISQYLFCICSILIFYRAYHFNFNLIIFHISLLLTVPCLLFTIGLIFIITSLILIQFSNVTTIYVSIGAFLLYDALKFYSIHSSFDCAILHNYIIYFLL